MTPPAAPALVVVAHPDDEAISFGGLIMAELRGAADIVVVTDGGFGGRAEARLEQLERARARLGARSAVSWRYPDHPMLHLPVDELAARLATLAPNYRAIFTHSPHGEYGHLNHIDVSLAVHRAFDGRAPVLCVADRLHPERVLQLDRSTFLAKAAIFNEVYAAEIARAWDVAPLSATEAFTRVSRREAELIHAWCTAGERPAPEALDVYRHLEPQLDRLVMRRPRGG